MTFSEAYKIINDKYLEWGFKGISVVGETKDAWIFKSHVIPNDVLSGNSMIVNKNNGDIRFFNIGRPEDLEIGYNAKIISSKEIKELLKAN